MKLIFIYGPPAVGKLTIAERLSAETGIALFHNHLTRDLVKDIYEDELTDNYELVTKIRIDVLEHCAKNDTDLIFTYVYGGQQDDQNVKDFTSAVEDNDGEIVFVELTASREDLIYRVDNESRKKFKKLIDKAVMAELVQSMEKFSIPFVDSIIINTSELTIEEAAKKIIDKL